MYAIVRILDDTHSEIVGKFRAWNWAVTCLYDIYRAHTQHPERYILMRVHRSTRQGEVVRTGEDITPPRKETP